MLPQVLHVLLGALATPAEQMLLAATAKPPMWRQLVELAQQMVCYQAHMCFCNATDVQACMCRTCAHGVPACACDVAHTLS